MPNPKLRENQSKKDGAENYTTGNMGVDAGISQIKATHSAVLKGSQSIQTN